MEIVFVTVAVVAVAITLMMRVVTPKKPRRTTKPQSVVVSRRARAAGISQPIPTKISKRAPSAVRTSSPRVVPKPVLHEDDDYFRDSIDAFSSSWSDSSSYDSSGGDFGD